MRARLTVMMFLLTAAVFAGGAENQAKAVRDTQKSYAGNTVDSNRAVQDKSWEKATRTPEAAVSSGGATSHDGAIPAFHPVSAKLPLSRRQALANERAAIKAEIASLQKDAAAFNALPAGQQTDQAWSQLAARKQQITAKVEAFNKKAGKPEAAGNAK